MKLLITISLLCLSIEVFAQKLPEESDIAGYEKYWQYKKEMYVDNLLKKKIPSLLHKNYYKNVGLKNYTDKMYQQYDTIAQVHRLYLFTQKANDGFLFVNKEITGFLNSLPESTEIIYIVGQDTVKNYQQVLELISLKEQDIMNVKYRRSDSGKQLIANILVNE